MSKSAKIAFTFSLILNVLLLGLVAGRLYYERFQSAPWKETKAALEPETHKVIKTTFETKGKEIFPLFKQAHQKKEDMKAVISAEEFDEEAYDALALSFSGLNNKFMEHRLLLMKVILSQLPQSERVKMADHTVDKLLGNPPAPGRREKARNKRFEDGDVRHKHGAIDAGSKREPFDVRKAEDEEPNQGE